MHKIKKIKKGNKTVFKIEGQRHCFLGFVGFVDFLVFLGFVGFVGFVGL